MASVRDCSALADAQPVDVTSAKMPWFISSQAAGGRRRRETLINFRYKKNPTERRKHNNKHKMLKCRNSEAHSTNQCSGMRGCRDLHSSDSNIK